MNKENTPSYKSDSVKISIFFLLAFILYAVGVVVFISKGDDKTVGAFEAVTGVSGLILSFATIFYVAKAYSQQKRQNDIQSEQIKIQNNQIEENKKDVEFNRIIDAIYRQLEFTRQIHLNRMNDRYGLIKLNSQIATEINFLGFDVIIGQKDKMARIYNMIDNVYTFTHLIINDVKLFNSLMYISNLEKEEINILTNIVNNNFLNEYKPNIDSLHNIFNTHFSHKEFVKILDYGHQLNNVLDMGSNLKEHHHTYLSKYKSISKGLALITDFTITNKTEALIEKYKVKAEILS